LLPTISEVLTVEQVKDARKKLDAAEWVDGKVTAGHQSARNKDNQQIPEVMGEMILNALGQNPLFVSATLHPAGNSCPSKFRGTSVIR
jgi:PKHD-type hydroxylase